MLSRYVTTQQILEIAEIKSVVRGRELLKEANELAKKRKFFIPNQKKAPRDLVYEILGQKQTNGQQEEPLNDEPTLQTE